ncbi:MAG: hypothetical protein KJN79_01175 [Gammaproteobacteria bacterium]|nr:hypothetical protein [Gammaproteobacteria bacterium]
MTLKPEITTGLPSGTKEAGRRVDFKPDAFDISITTKGYRCWWSRAAPCPCLNNPQTRQPDPTCPLCDGYGEMRFLPEDGLESYSEDAHGNPIEISDDRLSVGILVLMTGLSRDRQIFERFGEWVMGTAMCSTQPGNDLAWRDRLELRDSIMYWAENVEADGSTLIKVGRKIDRIRYRAVGVNMLRTVDTLYRQPNDFTVNAEGQIVWSSATVAPAAGTLLSVHYKVHPVFRIIDWPHAVRDTAVAAKTQAKSRKAQFQRLPTQCTAKLDFLTENEG